MTKNSFLRDPADFIIKPIVTEKATNLQGQNVYSFLVSPLANKIIVKQAIKKIYNFWPLKVRIINMGGKTVRYGRTRGKTKKRKKALVYLKPNQKIDFHKH